MSLAAGGLAQMTYQPHNNAFNSGLGAPASGFGSRREVHGSRLGTAPPSSISTEDFRSQQNGSPAPRTSRSHLLAGLRTNPKSPLYPSSAPPNQVQPSFTFERPQNNAGSRQYQPGGPQTSVGGSFAAAQRQRMNANGQMYALPEILAPPELQFDDEQDDGIDPQEYAQLCAQEQYLAQQQMRLQQQLLEITAAQQQFQGMTLNNMGHYNQNNLVPTNGFYQQQLQQGLQPVISPVPGAPGLYSVYNPMTGQSNIMVDPAAQNQPKSPERIPHNHLSNSPPPVSPAFRAQVSPPPEDNTPVRHFRSPSPPKKSTPPPSDLQALPPPSANAFRRHARGLSSVTGFASMAADGPKSALARSAGFPATPMTGTFGPGQARAGDHPIRQPRGPPALEELIDKPTSKHEGSKNFVTRQRRRAVNNLVRAGLERRGASRGSNSIDSPGCGTPSSEYDNPLSASSDSDNDSSGSRSVVGAIGSERKKMKSRSEDHKPLDSPITSVSSEEAETKTDGKDDDAHNNPLMVLANGAEKRKSSQF